MGWEQHWNPNMNNKDQSGTPVVGVDRICGQVSAGDEAILQSNQNKAFVQYELMQKLYKTDLDPGVQLCHHTLHLLSSACF